MSLRKIGLWFAGLAFLGAVAAACAPDPMAQLISPYMVAVTEEGITIVVRIIPKLAELTEKQTFAGVSEDVVDAIQNGDPVEAMELSELHGCAGCHSMEDGEVLSGPSWYDIGNVSVGRVDGESPALYLYNSITQPNAFVVKRFDGGVMPEDFSEKLTTAEIGSLIAYLLQQTEE